MAFRKRDPVHPAHDDLADENGVSIGSGDHRSAKCISTNTINLPEPPATLTEGTASAEKRQYDCTADPTVPTVTNPATRVDVAWDTPRANTAVEGSFATQSEASDAQQSGDAQRSSKASNESALKFKTTEFVDNESLCGDDEEEDPIQAKRNQRMRTFDMAVCTVVCLNVFAIALAMDFGPPDDAPLEDKAGWLVLESLFTLCFLIEIPVRINWERWQWHRSVWNWLDVFLVACAVLDVWVLTFLDAGGSLQVITVLRIMRLVRLVRMVKLVKKLQGLYCIIMALVHAFRSMLFLIAMLFFGVLLFSIFATIIIGRNSQFKHVQIHEDSVYERFGTVSRSMYSLFELMTLEGWEQVARPLVMEQPVMIFFIGIFLLIFTFGMLNMIVALVVEKTLDQSRLMETMAKAKDLREMSKELHRMRAAFLGSDTNKDGKLSADEFHHILDGSSTARALLAHMGIRESDASELFLVLDWNEDGFVTVKEFIQGCEKLQADTPSNWDSLAAHSGVRGVKKQLNELRQQVESELNAVADKQRKQGEVLEKVLLLLRGMIRGYACEEGS